MKRVFLVDFDGTITREDVCTAMAAQFCQPGYMEIDRRWRCGEISTQQCAQEIMDCMEVTEDQLIKLVYSIDVDKTFHAFVQYCQERKDMLWVVSDGYDFYIDPILRLHGWGEIPSASNRLYFKNDRIHLDFPHAHESCPRCGNCKGVWVDRFKDIGYEVVLIGDGVSDICGTNRADEIFAKKGLLQYCKEAGIPCNEFSDFQDIVEILCSKSNRKV